MDDKLFAAVRAFSCPVCGDTWELGNTKCECGAELAIVPPGTKRKSIDKEVEETYDLLELALATVDKYTGRHIRAESRNGENYLLITSGGTSVKHFGEDPEMVILAMKVLKPALISWRNRLTKLVETYIDQKNMINNPEAGRAAAMTFEKIKALKNEIHKISG